MPEYQRQLRHLLSLLAQFQQRRLPRIHMHQLRNILQHALVVFVHDPFLVCIRRARSSFSSTIDVTGAQAAVRVLLSYRRGSLGAGVLLGEMVRGLMPVIVLLGVLLVRVEVVGRQHGVCIGRGVRVESRARGGLVEFLERTFQDLVEPGFGLEWISEGGRSGDGLPAQGSLHPCEELRRCRRHHL